MIYTYNKAHVGDVLMVIVSDAKGQSISSERRGDVTRIYTESPQKTVAWNIFNISNYIKLEGSGQLTLTQAQIDQINQLLEAEQFSADLKVSQTGLVVGEIMSFTAHPDSDHLKICQVAVGDDELRQIVAGAPNVVEGLKTIVALDGSMLSNGSLIFAGSLRGQLSQGMMCSPRELNLPHAPQKRGIIELATTAKVGQAFDPKQHWQF